MKPKRTASRSRLEEMVSDIKQDILSGARTEGQFLPSELELGKQYSLSKNTVRKGLGTLVADGFIEKVPRIGARIVGRKQKSGKVIRFGYYPTLDKETGLLELVERFNELNPDIVVETYPVAYPNGQEEVEKYLQDGTYDVMTVNLYHYEAMCRQSPGKSLLEPFEIREELYDFLNAPFTSDGVQYVLPFVFSPIMLCYNKEHFRELRLAEPDCGWTWDTLRQAAGKLSEGKDRIGFYFHLMSENRWPVFLLQNDIRFERKEDGSYNLNDPRVKEAFETCNEIVQEHFPYHLSENDADAVSLFLNQRVSVMMATYSCLHALKEADFEYDIAPLPHSKMLRTLLVIIGLAVNKTSLHKPAARKFVDYLLSFETQLHIRQHTLNLPSRKQAAEWIGDEGTNRPYRFHMYREFMHTFRTYADLNMSGMELQAMRNELRFYWSKLESLDTVLNRLEHTL